MNHPQPSDGHRTEQVATDVISVDRAAAFAATIDHGDTPTVGDALPPLWHWLYFWSVSRQSALGNDGHPRTGGFLPDLGLPRRMWAGGRLFFNAPLTIGEIATRSSRVLSAKHKEGRSGQLGLVTLEHVVESNGVLAIREEQDIVYRGLAEPGVAAPAPNAAPGDARWQREITPSEVLLFRYSALTFNGHRIHYDRAYAQQAEGYPDLVVHGPLIATLLLDLVTHALPGASVREYTYKAIRPTFLGNAFFVCGRLANDGRSIDLWAKDHEGWLTMSGCATLA
ncbi:FAS1-like dehydratase domain-containing protein [Paraburkholderia sp. MM6662-R1]|uniref:FAS1-like dehydratase domain-containing protein n=1 Tax=Paraburkholderia sp. MM6662-R1 TaxID=2991066 RepID=UPI003D1D97E2